MTRSQAFTIGILIGFVVLVLMGMIALIFLPYERIFPSRPTPTLPPPTVILTPTFPKSLPTASLITPTPAEPTATNTRIPTPTPRPPRTPTPTVLPKLPTFSPKPTATAEIVTAVPIPTSTPSPTILPSPIPRRYSISFSAEEITIVKGECTDLKWQVEGAATVTLDRESVAASGKKKVCPKKDTHYQLTIRLPDGNQLSRTVKISVEEDKE
jgi:hypothetical protein